MAIGVVAPYLVPPPPPALPESSGSSRRRAHETTTGPAALTAAASHGWTKASSSAPCPCPCTSSVRKAQPVVYSNCCGLGGDFDAESGDASNCTNTNTTTTRKPTYACLHLEVVSADMSVTPSDPMYQLSVRFNGRQCVVSRTHGKLRALMQGLRDRGHNMTKEPFPELQARVTVPAVPVEDDDPFGRSPVEGGYGGMVFSLKSMSSAMLRSAPPATARVLLRCRCRLEEEISRRVQRYLRAAFEDVTDCSYAFEQQIHEFFWEPLQATRSTAGTRTSGSCVATDATELYCLHPLVESEEEDEEDEAHVQPEGVCVEGDVGDLEFMLDEIDVDEDVGMDMTSNVDVGVGKEVQDGVDMDEDDQDCRHA